MHGWNVFKGIDQDTLTPTYDLGYVSTTNPSRPRLSLGGGDRSIASTVTTRIALDVASFDFQHVKLDQNGRYLDTVNDDFKIRSGMRFSI